MPPNRTTYRCTFTLPIDLAVGINRVAKHLGVSQSALVTQLLSAAMVDLVRLVELAPAPGDAPEVAARRRGDSIAIVQSLVETAQREAADLGQVVMPMGSGDDAKR